ncbi:hypothetical protein TNCV_664591 [Trichonephila clavipes]|nr:hypothetical protein TNCV_664591 [Trichonephila clavipes]
MMPFSQLELAAQSTNRASHGCAVDFESLYSAVALLAAAIAANTFAQIAAHCSRYEYPFFLILIILNYGKDILKFAQSSENIIDAGSIDENEKSNVTPVHTSSEMKILMKGMDTY